MTQQPPILDRKTLLALNLGCYSLFLLPIALLSLLLLAVAESAGGRLSGAAFLALVAAGYLAAVWRSSERGSRRRWGRAALALMSAAGAMLLLAYLQSPPGVAAVGSPVRSIYLAGGSFERSSLANLVPEIDQFVLGSYPVGMADMSIDFAQAARLRGLIRKVYRPLRADPDFVALGSHMNLAYRHLFGLAWDVGHAYVYRPAGQASDARLPVLLFLHGSAGNFKAYTWLLKTFADRHGFALIAPSFGFGEWREPEGIRAVERCLDWIALQPGLNPDSVVLAGLSNGGKGVTRAATARPEAFVALFYISGVLEGGRMPQLRAAWGTERPIGLIHGANDRRLRLFDLQAALANLAQDSTRVRLEIVEDEDHFLLFSRPERVLRSLEVLLEAD